MCLLGLGPFSCKFEDNNNNEDTKALLNTLTDIHGSVVHVYLS